MVQQPPKFDLYEDAKKDFGKIGGSLWLYIIIQLIMAFVLSFCVSFMIHTYAQYETMNMLVTVFSVLISSVTVILYMNSGFRLKLKSIKFEFKPLETLEAMGMVYFINIALGIIALLLNRLGLPNTSPTETFGWSTLYNVSYFLYAVIMAPAFEEIIFRGMIYRSIARYNKVLGMLVASLFFGLIHLNLTQGVFAFFMSLAMCYMYEKTQSLSVTIGAHAMNNFLATCSSYFSFLDVISIALAIFGFICLIKEIKNIEKLVREEVIDSKVSSILFKRPTIVLYLIFTVAWIVISLVRTIIESNSTALF